MRRSIDPMCFQLEDGAGADPDRSCDLIVPMSLQLAIPWRVALQQSSPPLRQSRLIMPQEPSFAKQKSANGNPILRSCPTQGVQSKNACPTCDWRHLRLFLDTCRKL